MPKSFKNPKKPILFVKSNSKYSSNNYNFEERGYQIINPNILEVETLPIKQIQGNFIIIITSMNAIFALEKLNILKDNLIFTAGNVSANILKNLGYNNIIFGKNSAKSLLQKIIEENLITKKDNILYLSGKNITINIAQKLQQLGYKAQQQIIYKINAQELSNDLILDLKNNDINDIALFSKNGVDIFCNLCHKNNINLSNKNIFVISDNIANYCKDNFALTNINIIKESYTISQL